MLVKKHQLGHQGQKLIYYKAKKKLFANSFSYLRNLTIHMVKFNEIEWEWNESCTILWVNNYNIIHSPIPFRTNLNKTTNFSNWIIIPPS